MSSSETVRLADGCSMSRHDLHLENLRLDSSKLCALFAYGALGRKMKGGDKITLSNGRTMSQQEVFLEAIRLDLRYSAAYYDLA